MSDPVLEPIQTPLTDVKAIAASNTSAGTCALRKDGTVTCWPGGPLTGDYDTDEPRQIPEIDDAKQLTVGNDHASVLRRDGGVSCWGQNDYGQLGSGKSETTTLRNAQFLRGPTFIPANTPVDVVGLGEVQSLAANDNNTCAVLTSGETYCWGASAKEGNQLALPDYDYATFRSDPVPTPRLISGIPRSVIRRRW